VSERASELARRGKRGGPDRALEGGLWERWGSEVSIRGEPHRLCRPSSLPDATCAPTTLFPCAAAACACRPSPFLFGVTLCTHTLPLPRPWFRAYLYLMTKVTVSSEDPNARPATVLMADVEAAKVRKGGAGEGGGRTAARRACWPVGRCDVGSHSALAYRLKLIRQKRCAAVAALWSDAGADVS
jgi:hypothetical protein